MASATTTRQGLQLAEMATLGDALADGYSFLALPRWAMIDVGPATQTLAAVTNLATDEMFHKVETVAEAAMLEIPTCRRHLVLLTNRGLLDRLGRQGRRTVTFQITQKTKRIKKPYAMLPLWACLEFEKWSERAIFALLISRYTLEAGSGRRYCTRKALERDSGLSYRSTARAIDALWECGFVDFGDEFVDLNLDARTRLPLIAVRAHRGPARQSNVNGAEPSFDVNKVARITNARTRNDRWLILAAWCLMKKNGYSERWFYDALEGTRLAAEDGRLKGSPIAYWRSILKSEAADFDRDFDQDLAAVKVPNEYLTDAF